ncbi:hypothetical protein AM499_01870 [Bacillus sp. FJAT-22090]|uniref:DUF3006 domain-containing protein n=1 Tax=Bacillus sp. FJAT-22090 TaxID=1581038 RepID=UPI0006AFF42B|nr:DUF3006 domain-containing protein [Bacillus sp. FJAT-22090]ALC84695.1 hypothetical protein AM499_01870 [Bacillus sp. FJAT-22090]
MCANKYVVDRFDDFFVVLFEKDNKANKLVILKDKFTINAKVGDLLEIHFNKEKSGYDFIALKEETDDAKQRLLDLIEGMKMHKN